jgi:hypothetical protein
MTDAVSHAGVRVGDLVGYTVAVAATTALAIHGEWVSLLLAATGCFLFGRALVRGE